MPPQPPVPERRLFVKRVVLSTAAAMFLLASYVGGAPVVAGIVHVRFPAAEPVIKVFYVPLIYYARHSDLPGSARFGAYASWMEQRAAKWAR